MRREPPARLACRHGSAHVQPSEHLSWGEAPRCMSGSIMLSLIPPASLLEQLSAIGHRPHFGVVAVRGSRMVRGPHWLSSA
jgi:hypothetical protein